MDAGANLVIGRAGADPSRHRPLARRRGGFTLIELLVAMTIVGIILALGVPSMTNFLASRAAVANAEELAEALRFARSEAVKRGQQVTICSADTSKTELECSGEDSWLTGWIVKFGDKTLRVQNVVRAMASLDGSTDSVTFEATGIASSGGAKFVFKPNGDTSGDQTRTVGVNLQGQVSITKGETQ